MPLPSALIGYAEIIADRWLAASGATPLAEELVGKRIRIEVESSADRSLLSLNLLVDRGGIRLLPDAPLEADQSGSADATISGTPTSLVALALDKDRDSLKPARVSGDLQLVRRLSAHLQQGNFSLETLLTDWTGPQAAYHFSQSMADTRSWLADSGEKLAANLSDYLHYETNTLLNPQQWQELAEQITELERRTGALQRRLTALEQTQP